MLVFPQPLRRNKKEITIHHGMNNNNQVIVMPLGEYEYRGANNRLQGVTKLYPAI